MKEWIFENVLAFVVAVCTVSYTVINWFMLKESKNARRQKQTPYIISYLHLSEAEPKSIYLVVENVGEGYAKNVKFNVIKDSVVEGKMKLVNCEGIKYGISSFPSHYKLEYLVAYNLKQDGLVEDYIEIEIEYCNNSNKRYKNKYNLIYGSVFGQVYSSPPDNYLGQVAYYLKEIDKELKKKH
ncbi:MAG: hypothetical protein H6Q16_1566 [Bacteroidetes bacterium]|nr:hypothetical protein [Bacteroidota bacterium]